jgi:serine/threonine protein kinase
MFIALDAQLSIMLNIAKGLDYLHKRKPATIHRDMKSSNVLITARGVAKISDFGLARVRNSTRSIIKSLVGTVNWQAPELWVPHPRYNEKVDVYSSAMVFWECLQWHLSQKRYPFEGMNEHAIYQEVGFKKMRPSTATMRRQWGGDILDLIEKMWHQNPASRPTMSQVVEELEIMLKLEKAKTRAAAAASR